MVSNRDGRVTGKNLLSKRRSRGVDSGPPASQVNVHQPFFLQYFSSHHAVFLSMIYTVIFLLFFSISLKKHKKLWRSGGLIQVHHHPRSPCFLIWWPPKNWLSKHIHFTRVTRDGFYEEDLLQFQNICRIRFQRLLHNTLTWVWFFSTWWTNENSCKYVWFVKLYLSNI